MKTTGKIFNFIFIIFMGYVLLMKCLFLFSIVPTAVALAGSVLIAGLVWLVVCKWHTIRELTTKFSNRFFAPLSCFQMLSIILLCSLITKIALTCILQITSVSSHPDIQVYVKTAEELADSGIVHTYAKYCYSFSHMFWYAVFLTPAVKLFGSSQMVLSVYMSVISTVSLLLLFDLMAHFTTKEKAFGTSFILCFLPSQLLVSQYITHEHALLFFLIIAVWLYFRIIPTAQSLIVRGIYYALFILSLFGAYLMNAAGLVMIIAFILLLTFEMFDKVPLKKRILNFGTIAAIVLVVIAGNRICESYQLKKSEVPAGFIREDKVLWTLYVGANANTNAGWSFEDTQSFSAYPPDATYAEVQQFRKECLTARYKELIGTPDRLIILLKNKSVTVWSCFNYSIGFTNETIKNPVLQAIYHQIHKPLFLAEYAVSLLGAIWCFADNLRKRKTFIYDGRYLITELFLMGTTAMLLITECNNKYTLPMQLFFWMACLTLKDRKAITKEMDV